MAEFTIDEAQARWDSLLDEVEAGETHTVTREGRPVARLEPIAAPRSPQNPVDASPLG